MENTDYKFYHIVISGAGVSGTANFKRIVDSIGSDTSIYLKDRKIRITIIEKSSEFGPGLPYSYSINQHALLHVPAIIMSITPERMPDFVNYLGEKKRIEKFSKELPKTNLELVDIYCTPDPLQSYPRSWFGKFLKHEFKYTVKKAKDLGIEIELKARHEVTNFLKQDRGFNVFYTNLETKEQYSLENINVVILSTGWWEGRNNLNIELDEQYTESIYPIQKFKNFNSSVEKVAILGSNLSAVDAILAIFEGHGRFFPSQNPMEWSYQFKNPDHNIKIFCFSKTGRLPNVTGKFIEKENKYFNFENINKLSTKGYITLEEYLDLINRDLTELYGKSYTFDDIVKEHQGTTNYDNFKKIIEISLSGDVEGGALGALSVLLRFDLLIFRSIYLLDYDSRKIMEERYWPIILKYTSLIPMINSSKLLALMKSSLIEFNGIGDKNYSLYKKDEKIIIDFGSDELYHYDYLVDCRGYNTNSKKYESEFAQNMIKQKQTRDYIVRSSDDRNNLNFGGIDIDVDTFQLLDYNGNIQKNVFYTGIGAYKKIFTSAALVQGYNAMKISENILRDIMKN